MCPNWLVERLAERLDRKELDRPPTLIASEEEAATVPEISVKMSDPDLEECASRGVDEILDEIDFLQGLSGRTLEEQVEVVL